MQEGIKIKIYLITNKVDGKKYVGQTARSLKKRFQDHVNNSSCSKRDLSKAIKKYGRENFVISLLEEVPESKRHSRETFWIRTLNTVEDGYNMIDVSNHDDDEIEMMVKDFLNGKPQKDIEKEYQIHASKLRRILEERNIDTKRNTKTFVSHERKEEMIKLYKSGMTIREIQLQVGGCRKSISKYLKEAGIVVTKSNVSGGYKHPYKKQEE